MSAPKRRAGAFDAGARVGPAMALLSSYAVTYRVVEFSSHGATLRGRLYRPDGATRPPLVIMAHGTSATITMVSDRFAEAFADGGLAVLLYDHRGFGASDGEPRQEVNPWVQVRGILDALAFAETLQDEVNTARIGLWGLSYAGSLVIGATAIDHRCRAMVVQVPACSAEPAPRDPDGSLFAALRATVESGDLAAPPLTVTGPLPVVASDQIHNRSLLTPLSAFRWFMEHGSRHGCLWENRITRVIPTTPAPYHAGLCAPHITVPSLWIIAVDDEMAGSNPIVSRGVFDAAGGRKELIEIRGGHFAGLYPPAPPFDAVSGAERDFFRRELFA